jgi:hypothetical protein
MAAVLVLAIQACGSAPAASPAGSLSAQTKDGPFTLDFTLPKSTWATSEAIEGTATLAFSGSGGVDFGSSGGGPVGFGYVEVGGTRRMGPAWTADCHLARLEAGNPIVHTLGKSGGFGGEDPNARFYESFFADPQIHLPAGDWDITAAAEFIEGQCDGPGHTLKVTLRIHVTG